MCINRNLYHAIKLSAPINTEKSETWLNGRIMVVVSVFMR